MGMAAINPFGRAWQALGRYGDHINTVAKGLAVSRKPPIFVVGLPRSGTTWVASILNTAQSVKYFHEPFNCSNVPGAAKFCMRYLTPEHNDLEFVQRSRDAFAGRTRVESVRGMLSGVYRQFPWLPGRIVVKGVCSCLAVESIFESVSPKTVIVIRHPCAVAASWHRLRYDLDRHIATLLDQPHLLSAPLKPFQNILARAEGFWQKMGALWGATNHVLLQQCKNHPEWSLVQHEEFCRDAAAHFRRLFEALDLIWTEATDRLLEVSTKTDSTQPYLIHRVSEDEPDKWRKELSDEQAEQVLRFARRFAIPFYPDLERELT
jgi:hypothetical protein